MKKLNQRELNQNTSMYDIYFNEYHMEDGWYAPNKKQNFSLLLKLADLTGIPFSGTTCLDVGSGTGDFSGYLRQRGINEYRGYEIYEPSFQAAIRKYPKENFILGDFLAAADLPLFDYAFCSGALTVKLPDEDNYDYLEAMVKKMWMYSSIGIAFNVLTDNDPFSHPDLFFYSSKKVSQLCRKIIGDGEMLIEPTPGVEQIHVYLYRLGVSQLA